MSKNVKTKVLYIYSDGGSRGNPGAGAIGIIFLDENKKKIGQNKEVIGEVTNNQAEYKALIKALELATSYCRYKIVCFLDSELVVKQITGQYRIKNEKLRDLFYQVKEKEKAFQEVVYNHVKRNNQYIQQADKLVNDALNGR